MFLSLLVLQLLAVVVFGQNCTQCICQHESQCSPIGCNWDMGSLSCGYLQIKLPYYLDCGQPGKLQNESSEDAWKRCADDLSCASLCMSAYFTRYRFLCADKGMGECEQMARLHNGGPYGCSNSNTDGYWNVIKSCCGCS